MRRTRRRVLAPKPLNQSITRNDLVRVQQENRKQRAELRAAQRDGFSITPRLHESQHPELHEPKHRPVTTLLRAFSEAVSRTLGVTKRALHRRRKA
jgi:hypothetical protein